MRVKNFDENITDEVKTTETDEESFGVKYILYVVDEACGSLKTRFKQFQEYGENFEFLFDLKKFTTANEDVLKSYCVKLNGYLKYYMQSDIDGNKLFS